MSLALVRLKPDFHHKVFDIKLSIPLFFQQMKLQSKRITDGATVELKITLVKILDPTECLQLYNIVLRRYMFKVFRIRGCSYGGEIARLDEVQ